MGWSAQVRSFLRMKIPSSTELNWRKSQDRRHQHAPPAGGFWPGVFCRCRWAWGGCWSPGSSAGWSSGPRAQRTAAAWPPTGPGRCPPSAPRSGPASPHLSSAAAPGTAPVEHDTWLASQAQWQFGFRAPSYFPPPIPQIWSCEPPPVVSSCSRYSTCRTRHLASISSTVTVWPLSPQLPPPPSTLPPPPPPPRSGSASPYMSSAAVSGAVPVEHNTWLHLMSSGSLTSDRPR